MPRSQIRRGARPAWTLPLLVLLALQLGGFGLMRSCRAAPGPEAFQLLETGSAGLSLLFQGDPAGSARLADGTVLFFDQRHAESPSGADLYLPWASTWIALPPGARPRVEVRIEGSEPIDWPEGTTGEQRRQILQNLPPEGYVAGEACWTRTQWGCPVRFCPVIADGQGGLRQVRRAVLQVRFSVPPALRGTVAAGSDDPLEALYHRQFVNAPEARDWRRLPPAAEKAARRPLGDYFTSTPNPWIKVYVSRRGIFEIRGEDLRALGLALSSIDPATLRMFCPPPFPLDENLPVDALPSWMREIPIEVVGGEHASLDAADVIRFLGQGPDGWFEDLGVPPTPRERAFRDPYNNENVYWLTWGGHFTANPEPLRIPLEDRRQLTEPAVPEVLDRVHFEQDLVWNPRPKDFEVAPAQQAAWDQFHWLALAANSLDQSQLLRLALTDPIIDRPVRVRLRAWGNSFNASQTGWADHELQTSLNQNPLPFKSWSHLGHMDVDSTGTWLVSGEQELRILLPYHPVEEGYEGSTRTDQQYLEWVEMDYWRRLLAHGDSLSFFADGWSGTQTLELNGFTRSDVYLLDTSNPWAPVRLLPDTAYVVGSGYRARFRVTLNGERPARFLACTAANMRRPRMELDEPPEGGYLRMRAAAVQGLVVAPAGFLAAAQKLADFRRDHFPGVPGARVEALDIQDIMDEFSFGRQDPTALRSFLQFARGAWTGGRPEMGPAYVVLLGDAYFDYRGFLGRGSRSYVPTYEGNYDTGLALNVRGYSPQFASDDFFGYLDGANDLGLDLYIGRLPVRTLSQANAVVEKIISYEGTPTLDPWRGRITLIADDICQGTHPDDLKFAHMKQTEALLPLIPASLQVDKIYLYEYGPLCIYDRKPAAAADLQKRISEGTLLVNFTGHGSEQQLADERVLETGDVAGMSNRDRLFLFFTASCSVGMYDFAGEGLGESLLLQPAAGAVSVFSASAVAYSSGNAALNQSFFTALFPDPIGGPALPTGLAAAVAKAGLQQGQQRDVNSERYVLLGDPATRLAAPGLKVDLALKDARRQTALGDTLIRGMTTELEGRVLDQDGNGIAGFDGTANLRVYDSALLRQPNLPDDFSYVIRGAPIYRGQAPVVNGAFSMRFKVPSALATGNGGKGQVFVYVTDGHADGGGAIPLVEIPARSIPSTGGQGPVITLEVEGDPRAVSPRASFFASLKDTSGINITGLVGSRAVVAQIEQEGNLISAQDLSGQVVFPVGYDSALVSGILPADLKVGQSYDLTVRASNNLMKDNHAVVRFTMAGAVTGEFALRDLYNFPNPSMGSTTFFGTVTREAEMDVEIFTLSGRRIWRLERPVLLSPAEFAGRGIFWNGRDAEGAALANGVYLYRVTSRPTDGGSSLSKVERLVVYRER